ncbi:hypothetical protein LZ198_16470 [Myxococcus sp. K15C18031901]|uniref:hypothetical protein n=1 Tax=Myxococcus dinghuensis TaxID=2906761 RepID=UPI0020A764C4|nr:hypothetical protein [Myxococcus dinghuensis]MCP3100465.1 hypothetical protein [Myxococcus dinghuensis]
MNRLLPAGLCLLLASGCGGIKQMMGEEEYLRQQLYDYAYDVPLDALWTAGLALAAEVKEESRPEDGSRTAIVLVARTHLGERVLRRLVMRGWEDEGRSYLRFFEPWSAAVPVPDDIGIRDVETELALVTRFHPEDAERLRAGGRRAGQQAR